MNEATTIALFDEMFREGDILQRNNNLTVRIVAMNKGRREFRCERVDPTDHTRVIATGDGREKVSMGVWRRVGGDPSVYRVGDYVMRPGWVSKYDPVLVTAIGETKILGIRKGQTEEKEWLKVRDGGTLYRFDEPVGPRRAFKFVSKDGTTRNGAYQWPLPTGDTPVVVECDPARIVAGNHVCPDRDGDGVMAAKTVGAAESGGHTIRDSVGLWLEYDQADVLGEGSGKVRLRKVTVTGVFDPYVQLNKPGSEFSRLLNSLYI